MVPQALTPKQDAPRLLGRLDSPRLSIRSIDMLPISCRLTNPCSSMHRRTTIALHPITPFRVDSQPCSLIQLVRWSSHQRIWPYSSCHSLRLLHLWVLCWLLCGAIVCPQLWIVWNHHNPWCHFNFSNFLSFFWIAIHHVIKSIPSLSVFRHRVPGCKCCDRNGQRWQD